LTHDQSLRAPSTISSAGAANSTIKRLDQCGGASIHWATARNEA